MPGTIYDRGAGFKSKILHMPGRLQSTKGETAEETEFARRFGFWDVV